MVDVYQRQVLAETSLFTLQRRLSESDLSGRFDSPLHGVLLRGCEQESTASQHTFLGAQDDIGADFSQPFRTVVTDITRRYRSFRSEVAKRRPPSSGTRDAVLAGSRGITLRSSTRVLFTSRDSRNGFHDVQALECFGLALLRGSPCWPCGAANRRSSSRSTLQQRVDRFGAHHGDELVRVGVVELLVAFGQALTISKISFSASRSSSATPF